MLCTKHVPLGVSPASNGWNVSLCDIPEIYFSPSLQKKREFDPLLLKSPTIPLLGVVGDKTRGRCRTAGGDPVALRWARSCPPIRPASRVAAVRLAGNMVAVSDLTARRRLCRRYAGLVFAGGENPSNQLGGLCPPLHENVQSAASAARSAADAALTTLSGVSGIPVHRGPDLPA